MIPQWFATGVNRARTCRVCRGIALNGAYATGVVDELLNVRGYPGDAVLGCRRTNEGIQLSFADMDSDRGHRVILDPRQDRDTLLLADSQRDLFGRFAREAKNVNLEATLGSEREGRACIDPQRWIKLLSRLIDANPAHRGIGAQFAQRIFSEAHLIGVVRNIAEEGYPALFQTFACLGWITVELDDRIATRFDIGRRAGG